MQQQVKSFLAYSEMGPIFLVLAACLTASLLSVMINDDGINNDS
jgi:hypothetical protein